MEDIIIKKSENEHNGWFVEQGDEVSCECGWDEMMGLVSALTMPNDRGCLRWMKPKVEPYIPKDGDFVSCYKDDECKSIFIFEKMEVGSVKPYCIYFPSEKGVHIDRDPRGFDSSKASLKEVTEEEKQLLLSKLHEIGKDWNAETKEVVDWKWKPNEDECYYAPFCSRTEFTSIQEIWVDDDGDEYFYKKGWVFRTEEECQAMCDKLNKAIKEVK